MSKMLTGYRINLSSTMIFEMLKKRAMVYKQGEPYEG